MSVSPADFELYSRVTGRPVPRSPQARMMMAPEVNDFIRNRGYERREPTLMQKGADFLGKAAVIGGTLAAAHAVGGGFKGKGGQDLANAATAVAESTGVGKELVGTGEGTALLNKVDDFVGEITSDKQNELDKFRAGQNPSNTPSIPPASGTNEGVALLNKVPESIREQVDNFLEPEAAKTEEVSYRPSKAPNPGTDLSYEKGLLEEELNARKEEATGLTSSQRQQVYTNVHGSSDEESERAWENAYLDAMARDRDPGDNPPPAAISPSKSPGSGPYNPSSSSSPVDRSNVWDGSPPPPSGESSTGAISRQPNQGLLAAEVVPDSDIRVQRLAGDITPVTTNQSTLAKVGDRGRQDLATVRDKAQDWMEGLYNEGWGAPSERIAATGLAATILGRGGENVIGHGGLSTGGLDAGTGFNPAATGQILGAVGNLPGISAITGPAARAVQGVASTHLPGWLGAANPGITLGSMTEGAVGLVPGLSDALNAGAVTTAEMAGLGGGLAVGGSFKDLMRAGMETRKQLEPRLRALGLPNQGRPLSWQQTIDQTYGLGQATRQAIEGTYEAGKALGGYTREIPALAPGWERHDTSIEAAKDSLLANIEAAKQMVGSAPQRLLSSQEITSNPMLTGKEYQGLDSPDQVPGEVSYSSNRAVQEGGTTQAGDIGLGGHVESSDALHDTSKLNWWQKAVSKPFDMAQNAIESQPWAQKQMEIAQAEDTIRQGFDTEPAQDLGGSIADLLEKEKNTKNVSFLDEEDPWN